MRRPLIAASLCWCTLAASAPTLPPAAQELQHNARFWEAHDRGDLAQLALKKLVAARPDAPEPLVELGELDLRLNAFQAASEVETELGSRFRGSTDARDFAIELRVATADRLRFASIRRLAELNRISEVRAELDRLFPQGPPGGTLGIEYYRLLAQTPQGMAAARTGLAQLTQLHENDPRYQLALAQLLVSQSDTALEGVTLLNQLSERDDVRREEVERSLASGLARLGVDKAPELILSAYLARNPRDTELTMLRRQHERTTEEHKLFSPQAYSGDLSAAQRLLGKDLEPPSDTAPHRVESRRWLDRSRISLKNGNPAVALMELRAAVAFYRADYESEIAVAKDMETQGLGEEAGELLGNAVHLAPRSSWLCEMDMRWLITHERPDTAVSMLRESSCRLNAPSHDALLAEALQERAVIEANAGHTDIAMADLKIAIQLAPRDPWTRYRLAEFDRDQGHPGLGRSVMDEGAELSPNGPEMRYAQALYVSHLEDYAAAFSAVDAIDPLQRTPGMSALHDRMQVTLARERANRSQLLGDTAGAQSALREVQRVAARNFECATQLAYSWIALHEPEHGIALVQPYVQDSSDAHLMLEWAHVLNSAEDDARLRAVLPQLRAMPDLNALAQSDVAQMQRTLDLRDVRSLEHQAKYTEAGQRLDVMLAATPEDRSLRVARAELDLMAGRPAAARNRLASLVAEDPDNLDTRLSYVRALTDSGELPLARAQLDAVEARMTSNDEELQLSLARRQLALGRAQQALRTLQPLLSTTHPRAEVMMLAGRAELTLHHLLKAHQYFTHAEASATGADLVAARRAAQEIEDHLQSSVTAGLLVWHQPGDPGMSQLEAVTLPSAWWFSRGDGSSLIFRADAVWLNAGHWSTTPQSPLLLGTIQAAGAGAPLRESSTEQAGLSPGLAYQTPSLHMDIGTTPLGFLLPNVVGGVEWTPTWNSIDWTLGVARRAVASSELSYAGLRDPVTGTEWGGVVQTGPYAGFGIHREDYSVSANVRFAEITGTHIPENSLTAARLSSSWKLFSVSDQRIDAGASLSYWNYQQNLSNYTFGNGGYYSPQSYVSLSTPLELSGGYSGWNYALRSAVSYTASEVSGNVFYPNDPLLQAQAAHAQLPPGYSSPDFPGYHSTGFGFSAYAAAERTLGEGLVVGFALDIDRTNYYHPTSVGLYFRHAFGAWATRAASTPHPIRPYN